MSAWQESCKKLGDFLVGVLAGLIWSVLFVYKGPQVYSIPTAIVFLLALVLLKGRIFSSQSIYPLLEFLCFCGAYWGSYFVIGHLVVEIGVIFLFVIAGVILVFLRAREELASGVYTIFPIATLVLQIGSMEAFFAHYELIFNSLLLIFYCIGVASFIFIPSPRTKVNVLIAIVILTNAILSGLSCVPNWTFPTDNIISVLIMGGISICIILTPRGMAFLWVRRRGKKVNFNKAQIQR